MPLLRINAGPMGLHLHDCADPALELPQEQLDTDGPAIIMIHGYKYAPGSLKHCPHRRIFATDTACSWPNALGLGENAAHWGLCIAFGWHARGRLAQVHQRARDTGEALAALISRLRQARPTRPVHLIAHSLGAEIALSALEYLRAGTVDRIVLLTGASYQSRALRMLSTPAGRAAEVLNVVSRENDLFDLAFETLIPRQAPCDRALGSGVEMPNVVNLQIDCRETLRALGIMGLKVRHPHRRVCHWSAYRRPGIMGLYSVFLHRPDLLPITRLRGMLPCQAARRWSRILPRRSFAEPLVPLALSVKKRFMGGSKTGASSNEPAY